MKTWDPILKEVLYAIEIVLPKKPRGISVIIAHIRKVPSMSPLQTNFQGI